MKKRRHVVLLAFVLSTAVSTTLFADVGSVVKPGTDIHVDRYSAVARGRHGQWVRASALLKSNGDLTAQLGLETDSTFFGIAGTVTVLLKDKDGKVVGSAEMPQCAIAGKSPGKARRGDFTSKVASIPPSVVAQVVTVEAIPNIKEDNLPRPLGLKDWTVAIQLINIKT
jgi:hypothetical protein